MTSAASNWAFALPRAGVAPAEVQRLSRATIAPTDVKVVVLTDIRGRARR